MKTRPTIFLILFCTFSLLNKGYAQNTGSCLFKNPLCFYNTNVLNYLQVLHKNQQYDKVCNFIYGPAVDGKSKNSIEEKLSNARFGYSLKKVGIKQKTNTSWSLTYQRTILGTNETFKIECALVNDTCKVYMDEKAWNTIFN